MFHHRKRNVVHVSILSVYHNSDLVLIAGDFNLPGFKRIHPDPSTASPSANVILDLASHLGVCQLSSVANDRGVQLDLILGSPDIFTVSRAEEPLLAQEPCQPSLFVSVNISLPSHGCPERPTFIRNIQRCNLVQELRELVILKKTLHKKFKKSFDLVDYNNFRTIRRSVSRDCRSSYINHVNTTISSNVKIFWSFFKGLNRTSSMPSSLKHGATEAFCSDEMCELFVD
ncbi:hypothetical protein J6590_037087 [Homalodisca vitripennis]|nr:hypothetical protein J6590_037087 [Homalodisca vitripennis]